jgi:hypothetical protein
MSFELNSKKPKPHPKRPTYKEKTPVQPPPQKKEQEDKNKK